MPTPTESISAFAVAAPGLASLVADELREIGADVTEVHDAGVAFTTDPAGLYHANLHARIASRVIVRAASFQAAHFSDLEKRSRAIPWNRWIPRGGSVSVRATSRKSRLYHTGGVAQRVHEAIARSIDGVTLAEGSDEEEESGAQLVVVRIDRDACTISIDSSGDLLHRRGYRQAVAKAPLRETIAAAMLRASGWVPSISLLDPCCGSGTIPIEAAMIARRIPPGRNRRFAFETWPTFMAAQWKRVRAEGNEQVLPRAGVAIVGADRDAGAIEASRANAERAGVAGDVVFEQRPLSRSVPPAPGPGLLLTNPPYGERIGESADLRSLYATFGKLAVGAMSGWRVALLASDPALVGQTRLGLSPVLETSNGGIRVALFGSIPSIP
ncbi:MAG: class I SAM-dependent RNA methyltransferase [Cytophagaceae bacterium]|nr:class I SAM-dependent RNA methyltransferase [Gemmatimonadaceae bacterium]